MWDEISCPFLNVNGAAVAGSKLIQLSEQWSKVAGSATYRFLCYWRFHFLIVILPLVTILPPVTKQRSFVNWYRWVWITFHLLTLSVNSVMFTVTARVQFPQYSSLYNPMLFKRTFESRIQWVDSKNTSRSKAISDKTWASYVGFSIMDIMFA